jgi:hypothetical protein
VASRSQIGIVGESAAPKSETIALRNDLATMSIPLDSPLSSDSSSLSDLAGLKLRLKMKGLLAMLLIPC